MSQIFFFGDNHGEFEHIIEAVREHAPPAIGFIHGNHDTDSELDYNNLFGSKLADRNLHGRVVEIAGVHIAGLGGIFRGQVWQPPEPPGCKSGQDFARRGGKGNLWRGGLSLRHRSTIFPDVYEALAKQRADVLVTHEAPSMHPYGFAALEELARSLKVARSFHGHHHDSLDYSKHWAQMGHEAYGVGFCGITALDGTTIRAGDYDSVRKTRGDYGLPGV